MRKCFLLLCFLAPYLFISAQSDDPALNKRLQEYMQLSRELDVDKLMDYIHPKLFDIVPREIMAKSMKEVFEDDEMKLSFDSMEIESVSPVFTHEGAQYRKIIYKMVVDIRLLDTSHLDDPEFIAVMKEAFAGGFSGAQVSFNRAKQSFHISGRDVMMAIRDKQSTSWMFIGHDDNKQLINQLFPKAVIEKFELL